MKSFIRLIIVRVLGFLVHHANRLGSDSQFYSIKAKVLKEYGKPDGFDIQEIPGKPCDACDGSGHYHAFRDDAGECSYCGGNGWYKDPFYCILERYILGKCTFHTPGKRRYLQTPSAEELAQAKSRLGRYISHAEPTRYANYCKLLLFLLFNFNEFAYRITPYSWRNPGHYTWHLWKPKHAWQNIKHVISWAIRTRGKHVPLFVDLKKQRIVNKNHREALRQFRMEDTHRPAIDYDDLPF